MSLNNYKALFLSSSEATSYDSTIAKATWSLSTPLRFTVSENQSSVKSWPPTVGKVVPQIAVHSMSYTNFFVNISAALANNTINFSDDPLDPTKYTITIPDGSYDITTLNTLLVAEQIAIPAVGVKIFDILPDYTLNKAYILFAVAGWYVHFPVASTLLGFTAGEKPVGMSSLVGEICIAENYATFDNVELVCVSSNLSNDALAGSGLSQSNILYRSVPSAPISFAVKDQPANLLWVNSDVLSGSVSQLEIQLVNQSGVPINTAGQNFNIGLLIRY